MAEEIIEPAGIASRRRAQEAQIKMTNVSSLTKPLPPPLPRTTRELVAQRRLKSHRTINDEVEPIYLALYEDEVFHSFLFAVYDEQAIEGSLAADNIEAARMIRDYARKQDKNGILSKSKLATIVKAMGVVQRRYGESRKDRRNMVGGEVVPGDNE